MAIIFDEIAHTYTEDRTGEQLPPVNHILNAVYGSGYEFVNREILNARAERGKEIHLDAHNWLTAAQYYGIKHIETRALVGWLERNDVSLKAVESEKIVSVSGMFAGTADLVTGTAKKAHLWDYKTNLRKPTRKMLDHWQKQLSFYKYALDRMGYKIEQMTILHLSGENCTPYELKYLGDKFVEDTVKAYNEGRQIKETQKALANIDRRTVAKLERTLKKIALLEQEIKPIREKIKNEMETRGITAVELGDVSVTYVAPGKRKSLDTAKFKAEKPEIYEKYLKETTVDSSIRIKIKEK